MKFPGIDPKRKVQLRLLTDDKMLTTQAAKKRTSDPPPIRKAKANPMRRAPWDPPPEETDPPAEERGDDAVLHSGDTRGRRSRDFPDLNITATARRLGVTKSHLAKVLAGQNRPSIDLAMKIAEALGKDLNYVVGLYKSKRSSEEEN